MPTVSVIIPTFNRAEYLCEAIRSVLAQTYQDFELIVIDDGSTDDTPTRLNEFGNRIKYLSQNQSGPSVARNRGIFAATGRYVAFIDSDDYWYPNKLERQIAILDNDPAIGLVFTDCTLGAVPDTPPGKGVFAESYTESEDLFTTFSRFNPVWPSSVVCRRDVFATSGIMDCTLRGGEDYDLWVRIAYVSKSHFIPEVLTHLREHAGRTTKSDVFLPAVCRAYEMQVYRWAFLCAEKTKGFRRLTASQYGHLAYTERQRGRFKEAYSALRRSMLYRENAYRLWPRAIALGWFPWIFRAYDVWRSKLESKQ